MSTSGYATILFCSFLNLNFQLSFFCYSLILVHQLKWMRCKWNNDTLCGIIECHWNDKWIDAHCGEYTVLLLELSISSVDCHNLKTIFSILVFGCLMFTFSHLIFLSHLYFSDSIIFSSHTYNF
jgi:hypothetical protein